MFYNPIMYNARVTSRRHCCRVEIIDRANSEVLNINNQ